MSEPQASGVIPIPGLHPAARVLSSKLARPPVPGFAILRHPLVRRLDAAVQRKVTFVVAPPGYGKSVVLAQWSGVHAARRVAWLTVDEDDNDANRFARHLCAALGLAQTDGGSVLTALEHGGDHMGAAFVAALLRRTARLSPTVVVLDDLHRIANRALLVELTSFVELAGAPLHFVFLARTDPPLALDTLRLDDQVIELRKEDLAFGREDTAELVRRVARCTLNDKQLDTLLATTEGWAAGLQLAAQSLRGTPDIDAFLESFAGDDRHIAEYLTEQVLQHLPLRIQRFLLLTSVLEQLSAPLCGALTGDLDGQEVLEHLDHRSLFVSRLDNRREWYRYHPLFRTLLQHRLHAADPMLERSLLEAAADWYLARDDPEAAVRNLVAAGSWPRVLEAVSTYGDRMYRDGRIAGVVRWLDMVPATFRHEETIALRHAYAHTMAGNSRVAEALLGDIQQDGPTSPTGAALGDVIRTCWVHQHLSPGDVRHAATSARAALATLPPTQTVEVLDVETAESLQRLTLLNVAFAEAYDGDPEAARRSFQGVLAAAGRGHVSSDIAASSGLAMLAGWSGELRASQEHGARALDVAEEAGLQHHFCTAYAHLALAHVARERDELDAADGLLQEAAGRAHQVRAAVPLTVHAIERSLLALARADPDEGLLVLMRHKAAHPVAPPAVAARLRATEATLLVAIGDVDRARAVLELSTHAPTPPVLAAAVRVAVARRDLDEARSLLARLAGDAPDLRSRVELLLWQGIVARAAGQDARGTAAGAEAVRLAQYDEHVRLFLDGGHLVLALLRELHRNSPTPYLRRLVQGRLAPTRPAGGGGGGPGLPERLSDRERLVLGYLPTHLANDAIAVHLCVSTNTLKTHLKHIYRKLGVSGRREAVETAERLQLL